MAVNEGNTKVKMIALDLDRTALYDDRTLSDATACALEEAGRRGVRTVIATGRTFSALPGCVFGLDCVSYFICSNGALIYDAGTKELLRESSLDPAAVETMTGLVKDKGYMFESFTEGHAYIGRKHFEMVREGQLLYRNRNYVLTTRTPVDDIYAFTLSHKERIENLNVFFPTPEEKEEMRPLLEAIPDSVLTSSVPSNYELGPEGVSKGAALMFVMEREGISKESLLAAGDSPNDISMLELAGIPVAVGNAEESVKKAACFVAPPNDEDGVACAVRKFVLG